MRDSYYTTDDTLCRDRLPSGEADTELRFQPPLPSQNISIHRILGLLLACSSLGTVTIYALRLMLPILPENWTLTAITLGGLYTASSALSVRLDGPAFPATAFRKTPPWLKIIAIAAAGPIAAVALRFVGVTSSRAGLVAFLVLTVFCLSVLCNRIFLHQMLWLMSKPDDRQPLHRYMHSPPDDHTAVPKSVWWFVPRLAVGALMVGWIVMAVSLVQSVAPKPLIGGVAVLVALGSLFLTTLGIVICFCITTQMPWTALVKHYWEAMRVWINFEPHPFAPGVLRIPIFFGRLTQRGGRVALIATNMIILVALVVPAGGYFPVALARPDPWVLLMPAPPLPPAPTDADAMVDISKRLPGATAKISEQTYQRMVRLRQLRIRAEQQRAAVIQRFKSLQVHLDRNPEVWVSVATRGLVAEPVFFSIAIVTAIALCVLVPIAFFVLLSFLFIAPPIAELEHIARLAKSPKPGGSARSSTEAQKKEASDPKTPDSPESSTFVRADASSVEPVVVSPPTALAATDAINVPLFEQDDDTSTEDDAPTTNVTCPNIEVAEPEWETYVGRLLKSNNPIERDSLFLGIHDTGNYPVLYPRQALVEHGHILGDSGSGKTALTLATMCSQLIRMIGRDIREPQGEPASVVILDLKGDMAMFHNARIEAERVGLPFRWFHPTVGQPTFAFNPLTQEFRHSLHLSGRVETLADALSLSHGEGYGRSFFSRINRRVLGRFLQAFPRCQSLREIHEHSRRKAILGKTLTLKPKQMEDAEELFAAIENLAPFSPLNFSPSEALLATNMPPAQKQAVLEHTIDFTDVVRRPQVVYFYLPSLIGSASGSEIGKLALFSLLTAATLALRAPGRHHKYRIYLFIDEFQRIVGENIKILLQQARSSRVCTVVANQTLADLVKAETDLRPLLQSCTRLRQTFTVTDPTQLNLMSLASGQTVDYSMSWTDDPNLPEDIDPPVHVREILQPRITINDLIRTSNDSGKSIVHIPRSFGFAQFEGFPFIMRSMFHITLATHEARDRTPFPDGVPGTFSPEAKDTIPSVSDPPATRGATAKRLVANDSASATKVQSNNNSVQVDNTGAGADTSTDVDTQLSDPSDQGELWEQRLQDADALSKENMQSAPKKQAGAGPKKKSKRSSK